MQGLAQGMSTTWATRWSTEQQRSINKVRADVPSLNGEGASVDDHPVGEPLAQLLRRLGAVRVLVLDARD